MKLKPCGRRFTPRPHPPQLITPSPPHSLSLQSEISYEPEPAGEANLAICSNHVANRFGCLGVTLEQPFKVIVAGNFYSICV